jgi:N,N'-diacetyllegionaminate synthase
MSNIGGKNIGDGNPCFITLEAGPTHNGLESAIRLCRAAAKSCANAVKFQILDPDRLIADRKVMFRYDVLCDKRTGRVETVEEPLYDILSRRALSKEQWRTVKQICDELDLLFFATIGFPDEIDLLHSIGCPSIKIASGDLNHFPLIRRAAKLGLSIQIDTGSSSLGEVEAAVDVIQSEGNSNIIIHHCPSGYPARLEGINLRIIQTLKQMFPFPIAFSDHSTGWEMDVAALALGANMLEKTITEDRCTRSVEHIFSIEPDEAGEFVRSIRGIETAFGNPRRILHAEERQTRLKVRRSVYLKQDVQKGDRLAEEQVEFRRPGYGMSPDQFESAAGHRFASDLKAGHLVLANDLLPVEA